MKVIVLCSIVLCLQSCVLSYIPNAVNSPMLKSKGDNHLSFSLGASGGDMQFAYACTDHVGIMANLNGWAPIDINDLLSGREGGVDMSSDSQQSQFSNDAESHVIVEVGGGVFEKINQQFQLEVYTGLGYANYRVGTADLNGDLIDYIYADCYRFFIKPAVGYSVKKFDISMASRFSRVQFFPKSQYYRNMSGFFVEPALTFRWGTSSKYFVQIGCAVPANGQDIQFKYQPFLFSVGLQFPLFGNNK